MLAKKPGCSSSSIQEAGVENQRRNSAKGTGQGNGSGNGEEGRLLKGTKDTVAGGLKQVMSLITSRVLTGMTSGVCTTQADRKCRERGQNLEKEFSDGHTEFGVPMMMQYLLGSGAWEEV